MDKHEDLITQVHCQDCADIIANGIKHMEEALQSVHRHSGSVWLMLVDHGDEDYEDDEIDRIKYEINSHAWKLYERRKKEGSLDEDAGLRRRMYPIFTPVEPSLEAFYEEECDCDDWDCDR